MHRSPRELHSFHLQNVSNTPQRTFPTSGLSRRYYRKIPMHAQRRQSPSKRLSFLWSEPPPFHFLDCRSFHGHLHRRTIDIASVTKQYDIIFCTCHDRRGSPMFLWKWSPGQYCHMIGPPSGLVLYGDPFITRLH
jgi:hypothetical protein